MLAQNGDAGSAAAQTALPESDEAHLEFAIGSTTLIRRRSGHVS